MDDLFDGVVGHAGVIGLLQRDVAAPAHAYLFVGPHGVGKATVARLFAAGIACGDDPKCRRRVVRGLHPDVILVEPDGRSAITVEQARNTVALANLAPVEVVLPDGFRRCGRVIVTVRYEVPAISLPRIGGLGSITAAAVHAEVIDPYRSGPAEVGTCP
mgnify:CR=1 FL=1